MRRAAVFRARRAAGIVVALVGVMGVLLGNPANWSYDISGEQSGAGDFAGVSEVSESGEAASGAGGSGYASEADSNGAGGADSNGAGGTSGAEQVANSGEARASEVLEKLEVKGRAPKTNYKRTEFYDTWPVVEGCNLRQRIIKRDFGEEAEVDENCNVVAGRFYEPYTGQIKEFATKAEISKGIQIDHVVALSDAWQKGAQYFDKETRYKIATDPLNLLAVDASANQQKSDGDAATWLPSNKAFRCQYVARQISVKYKYKMWVTGAEKEAMTRVLRTCPEQGVWGV